jgi:hypothetical protein
LERSKRVGVTAGVTSGGCYDGKESYRVYRSDNGFVARLFGVGIRRTIPNHTLGSSRWADLHGLTLVPVNQRPRRSRVFAFLTGGGSGIFKSDGQTITTIADTNGPFSRFDPHFGFVYLPVINNSGAVVFRATTKSGSTGIFVGEGGLVTLIADDSLNSPFGHIGPFWINSRGTVVFQGSTRSGVPGVYISDKGTITKLYDSAGPLLESAGGFLGMNDAGTVAFLAISLEAPAVS